jgi:hypothetical protein
VQTSRSKDDEAEKKLREDLSAAKQKERNNRALRGEVAKVLNAALTNKDPHVRAAAKKIKNQLNLELGRSFM